MRVHVLNNFIALKWMQFQRITWRNTWFFKSIRSSVETLTYWRVFYVDIQFHLFLLPFFISSIFSFNSSIVHFAYCALLALNCWNDFRSIFENTTTIISFSFIWNKPHYLANHMNILKIDEIKKECWMVKQWDNKYCLQFCHLNLLSFLMK